jgi:xanthine dehydrogenase small subunit
MMKSQTSLTGYFLSNSNYNIEDATNSMDGNICRCTGHPSIIRAAIKSAEYVSSNISNHSDHISALIIARLIPKYFSEIASRLKKIKQQELWETDKGKVPFSISGGTDLYVQQWESILKNDVRLLSSNGVPSTVREKNHKCIIGAKATVSDVMNSNIITKYFPSLKDQLKLFGSLPIRNKATIGGNIVNASPIADMTSIFLALNSTLKLKKESNSREILLRDFYNGYKSFDLKEGELIEEISFEIPRKNSKFNFEKVSQRTYLDIASANSSIYIEHNNSSIENCSISAGGVAPVPLFLKQTSEFLIGKEINYLNISEAAVITATEISPISDARGSAEYKSMLLRQLIYAHFITLFPDKINIREIA